MDVDNVNVNAKGIRITAQNNGVEVGHAYLYLMHNDLHGQPFALMEDVHVAAAYRGQGIGSQLVKQVVELARNANCYKLIATSRLSRSNVHSLYQRLGLTHHGLEFRIDF